MSRASVCPDCGGPIGLWAAKFAWLSGGAITCPRCKVPLAFAGGKPPMPLQLLGFVGPVIVADLAAGRLVSSAWLRPLLEGVLFLVLIGLVSIVSALHLTTRVPMRRKA